MSEKNIVMGASNLIAHRGDNTHYPENTLVAIEAALKAGATSFEFDVQMNADHSLVAFHDSNFLRMNGTCDQKIYDVSDVQMAQLSVHQPNRFEEQHYPTAVSYFDEIISLLKRYPKVQAFIEIKNESLNFWGLNLVMNELLKRLDGLERQAIVIGFNELMLTYVKAHSKLKIGLVIEEYSERTKAIATQLNSEYLICDYKILPKENVWQASWYWMVYTVNDIDLAKNLLKRGDIDFLETDNIKLLLNA